MQLEDAATILSRADFFQICNAEQRRLLAFASERRRHPAGATIYKSGDVSEGAHVLVSGTVTVATDGPAENPKIIQQWTWRRGRPNGSSGMWWGIWGRSTGRGDGSRSRGQVAVATAGASWLKVTTTGTWSDGRAPNPRISLMMAAPEAFSAMSLVDQMWSRRRPLSAFCQSGA
jgi:CRP-like cAMP-binding protein